MSQPIPMIGLPGTWVATHGRCEPDAGADPGYVVTFFLGVPGVGTRRFADDGYSVITLDPLPGDSLLYLQDLGPNAEHKCSVRDEARTFRWNMVIRTNAHGRMASLEVHALECGTPHEALARACENALPILNGLSYRHDVSISLEHVFVRSDREGRVMHVGFQPEEAVAIDFLDEGRIPVPVQLGPLYSMYREAISATNPFYQFLAFYRLLEGIKAVTFANGVEAPGLVEEKLGQDEIVPQDFRGWKVNRFLDWAMKTFRTSFAHFENDALGLVHVPDYITDMLMVSRLVPVVRLAVKIKLDNLSRRVEHWYKAHPGPDTPESTD